MMRSTLCAVLLAISLLMPGNVDARDSSGAYQGFGATCGRWVESKDTDSKHQWLDGYMTAINVAVLGRYNFFKAGSGELDAPTLKLYVDKYCRENPLKNNADAMAELLKQLMVPGFY